jgi:3D (Asp-Asp-Asp) domain-containing protein
MTSFTIKNDQGRKAEGSSAFVTSAFLPSVPEFLPSCPLPSCLSAMIISNRFWRRTIVTGIAACCFVSMYEVKALDSRYVARLATLHETFALPLPGSRLAFSATAYCKGMVTTSGVAAQTGVVAADPELLPVGSVIEVDSLPGKYNGIYTVMDTGPAVQGRQIDVYMWSCNEALQFGRRPVHLNVLRLGWSPRATTPSLLERLFKKSPDPLPARPLPQLPPSGGL